MKFLKIILLFLLINFFTGCVSLTKELPSYETYSLNLTNTPKKSIFINKSIKVLEPVTITSLDNKHILYTQKNKKNFYLLSKWSDTPAIMLQQLISKSLTISNSFKYVTTSNTRIESDFSLKSELVDFQHKFIKNKSYAIFNISVFLINNKTKRVYFKNFSYKQEAKSNNANSFVQSINKLSNKFIIDLQLFIQSKIL